MLARRPTSRKLCSASLSVAILFKSRRFCFAGAPPKACPARRWRAYGERVCINRGAAGTPGKHSCWMEFVLVLVMDGTAHIISYYIILLLLGTSPKVPSWPLGSLEVPHLRAPLKVPSRPPTAARPWRHRRHARRGDGVRMVSVFALTEEPQGPRLNIAAGCPNQGAFTARSHPGHIQVTSRSHPGHIQVM